MKHNRYPETLKGGFIHMILSYDYYFEKVFEFFGKPWCSMTHVYARPKLIVIYYIITLFHSFYRKKFLKNCSSYEFIMSIHCINLSKIAALSDFFFRILSKIGGTEVLLI